MKTDQVVLLLHWGGRVEGGLYPDYNQPAIAKQLIDAGADLVIGHHSHTLQPYEVYKGKYIFYSLGNFCFSDYWFEGKFFPMPLRRQLSTIVNVSFQKDSYHVELLFYRNLMHSFRRINYINRLSIRNIIYRILFINKLLWNIYYFNKRKILPFVIFMTRKDLSLFEKTRRMIKSINK